MELEFENIVKVEDTQIGSISSSNDMRKETVECLCKRCKRCFDYQNICKEIFRNKMTIKSLRADNKDLSNEVKRKEEQIGKHKKKNENLKNECKNLFSKVYVLNQEKHNLKIEVNELKQKLKGKELSLEYQTDQLNNCRAEYSKINQQYMLLKVQSEEESSYSEPGYISTSTYSMPRRVNDPPSSNRTSTEKSAAKSDVQGYKRISSVSEVSVQSSSSSTSPNVTSSSHQNPPRANQTSPQSKEIKCSICLKTFLRPCALASHLRVHAKDQQRNSVGNDVEMNDEEVSADNELQCPICFKICLNACGLASHQRFHTREQQKGVVQEGSCIIPNNRQEKQVTQKGVLLHCEKCGKKFTRQKSWEDHQRLHRIYGKKNEKKRFACKKCNSIFSFPHQLKEHMSLHMGEKPLFKCEICLKIFRYRGSFFQHSLVHGINKAFQCVKCKYAFTKKAHLVEHMQVHHKYN